MPLNDALPADRSAPATPPIIEIFHQQRSLGQFSLVRREVIVGSSRTAHVRIGSRHLSPQHCRLILDGSDLLIERLEGSFKINGCHVGVRTAVYHGDRIEIGPLVLQVSADPRRATATPLSETDEWESTASSSAPRSNADDAVLDPEERAVLDELAERDSPAQRVKDSHSSVLSDRVSQPIDNRAMHELDELSSHIVESEPLDRKIVKDEGSRRDTSTDFPAEKKVPSARRGRTRVPNRSEVGVGSAAEEMERLAREASKIIRKEQLAIRTRRDPVIALPPAVPKPPLPPDHHELVSSVSARALRGERLEERSVIIVHPSAGYQSLRRFVGIALMAVGLMIAVVLGYRIAGYQATRRAEKYFSTAEQTREMTSRDQGVQEPTIGNENPELVVPEAANRRSRQAGGEPRSGDVGRSRSGGLAKPGGRIDGILAKLGIRAAEDRLNRSLSARGWKGTERQREQDRSIQTNPGKAIDIDEVVDSRGRDVARQRTISKKKEIEVPTEQSGIGKSEFPGFIPKNLVDRVVQSPASGIKLCYLRQIQREPGFSGRVNVEFVVSPDGSVNNAKVESSTLSEGHDVFHECLLNRVRQLAFPQPTGGAAYIEYGFDFRRLN